MIVNPADSSQVAWSVYKTVSQVVKDELIKREKDNSLNSNQILTVSNALKQLRDAFIMKYPKSNKKLYTDYTSHDENKKMLKDVDLTEIHQVLYLRMYKWIPAEYDCQEFEDGSRGPIRQSRADYYRRENSLISTLNDCKINYPLLHNRIHVTAEIAWKMYANLDQLVFRMIKLCAEAGFNKKFEDINLTDMQQPKTKIEKMTADKIDCIVSAMNRLGLAIIFKYKIKLEDENLLQIFSPPIQHTPQPKAIVGSNVERMDLCTYDTFLDAKFYLFERKKPKKIPDDYFDNFNKDDYVLTQSVREALNISTQNPFSRFKVRGPLWGKSLTLSLCEQEISKVCGAVQPQFLS